VLFAKPPAFLAALLLVWGGFAMLLETSTCLVLASSVGALAFPVLASSVLGSQHQMVVGKSIV